MFSYSDTHHTHKPQVNSAVSTGRATLISTMLHAVNPLELCLAPHMPLPLGDNPIAINKYYLLLYLARFIDYYKLFSLN
jgi:hypothetical protein